MNQAEVSKALQSYADECAAIIGRFYKNKDGLWMDRDDTQRFDEIYLELSHLFRDEFVEGEKLAGNLLDLYENCHDNYVRAPSFHGVQKIQGLVKAILVRVSRNAGCLKSTDLPGMDTNSTQKINELYKLGKRFHLVAKQLSQRRQNRPTIKIEDEYDVQDLFHALLRMTFDDIRPEEWTPNYAGGASRMDFILPEIRFAVEIKKTRNSLADKTLGEQLILDIEKYRNHPDCDNLFCFIYDPDGLLANPRGLENDLNDKKKQHSDFMVHVMIVSS